MAGVTGLRPLTNDSEGKNILKYDNPVTNINKESNGTQPNTEHNMSTYVTEKMCNLNVNKDEYSDDETVKTAHSSMNNTSLTIDTDTTYDNVDDYQNTLPADAEWIQVNNKTSKHKQSVLTANASDETSTPVNTLLKNRGEQMIDTTKMLINPVKIEFLLTDHKNLICGVNLLNYSNACKK